MPTIIISIPNLTEITEMGLPELDKMEVEAVRFEIHPTGHATLTGEFWVSSDDLPDILDQIKDEVNAAIKVYRDA